MKKVSADSVKHVQRGEPKEEEVEAVIASLQPVPALRGGLLTEARDQPEVSIETITPTQAAHWLTANIENRDLRKTRVTRLAGVLKRGEWELTNDAIAFDTNGLLRNGQHRLTSVVVADVPAQMIVVRGLKPAAQDVMDQVLSRNLADALKLRGEKNWNNLASMLNWMYRFAYMETTGNVHFRDPGERATTVQCLAILQANPDLRVLVRKGDMVRKNLPVRVGMFLACWYRLRLVDIDEADEFVKMVLSGENLSRTDPAYLFRRAVLLDQARGHRGRMPDYREGAMFIKAWNAYREGKEISHLTFKYGAGTREKFPIPK